jgi:hypothetical protein
MAKSLLLLCPSCERHVRIVDSSCPFCGLGLSEATRASLALRPAASGRLSRAAFYALSMGTLTLAAACSSSSTNGGGDDGGEMDGTKEACVCPPYGQPAYGAPADARAVDVGTNDAAQDAGEDVHEGGVFPPYGHPPVDGGSDD